MVDHGHGVDDDSRQGGVIQLSHHHLESHLQRSWYPRRDAPSIYQVAKSSTSSLRLMSSPVVNLWISPNPPPVVVELLQRATCSPSIAETQRSSSPTHLTGPPVSRNSTPAPSPPPAAWWRRSQHLDGCLLTQRPPGQYCRISGTTPPRSMWNTLHYMIAGDHHDIRPGRS